MSSIQIGRLQLGPPLQWHEAVGDPVTNMGGQPIPAPRQALRHMVDLATYAPDGATDTVAARLTIRRQLRSLFNNSVLKLAGGDYVIYSDDPEQNGWYVPDFGSLADIEAAIGLATGLWKLEQIAWIVAGRRRTHKEAKAIWMKSLVGGLNYRDTLKAVYSTDFAALPALQLSVLPNGATLAANAVNGQRLLTSLLPVGRDLGQCLQTAGLADLTYVSYERPESAMGPSDVICYDRRGGFIAQTGLVRSAGAYQLLSTDLGVIQLTGGAVNTLPLGLDASAAPLTYLVKNGTTAAITTSTGTAGKINNWAGGIQATSTTIASGETGIYMLDTNYIDWISL